ncbi:MAG: DUF4249 domain-containing protein [Cytophagaceae bacterium]|jgi:hypothetical protein|nr:DUF4249 domain-containing protein [Cytophagaceae bacterium]
MKTLRNFLMAILFIGGLGSCTEVIQVDLDEDASRVVVEGLVTDRLHPFEVKVSRTISFSNESLPPTVDNATVSISDNAGNTFPLTFVSKGLYTTSGPVQGVVGRIYTLSVTVDGVTYTASDQLNAIPPIDSMYTKFQEVSAVIPTEGYYAYASSTDPPNEQNYYQYKFYKNGEPVGGTSGIFVNDDRFLSSSISNVQLPDIYEVGDTVKMEQLALSRTAYLFYSGLFSQLNNDGGFFSTPPANAPTNLSGGALGFFQASGIASDSVVVKP